MGTPLFALSADSIGRHPLLRREQEATSLPVIATRSWIDHKDIKTPQEQIPWCPWPAVTYFLNYPNLWRF